MYPGCHRVTRLERETALPECAREAKVRWPASGGEGVTIRARCVVFTVRANRSLAPWRLLRIYRSTKAQIRLRESHVALGES